MHGDGCAAAVDPLREDLGIVPLVLIRQQRPEILDAFVMRRASRFQGGTPKVMVRGQVDAVGGKPILNQRYADAFGCFVV
jgi:hypothetical protein